MRDIKFRAFHKQKQKMYKVKNLNFFNGVCEIYKEYSIDDPEGHFFDSFNIMQYIGFKDKNKKEVYFSDILEYKKDIFLVEEDKYTFNFYLENIKNGDTSSIHNVTSMKIIGDLYSNTELLNLINRI